MHALHRDATTTPDPRLEHVLRRIVLIGLLLVLALPAARGHGYWLGAGPLWLLGMPLASWWALHRFRLPRLPQVRATATIARRRRSRAAQARRRPAPPAGGRIAHAA
ncbi:MAG: hypothetical protein ABIO58_05715 [Luteimonas sp.]